MCHFIFIELNDEFAFGWNLLFNIMSVNIVFRLFKKKIMPAYFKVTLFLCASCNIRKIPVGF